MRRRWIVCGGMAARTAGEAGELDLDADVHDDLDVEIPRAHEELVAPAPAGAMNATEEASQAALAVVPDLKVLKHRVGEFEAGK